MRGIGTRKYTAFAGALLVALSVGAAAQPGGSITGLWLTDTRDGVVEIRPCGGRMCGYITAILNDYGKGKQVQDILNENPKLRSRPICGLNILGDLKSVSAGTWGDGWVYDPKRGKTFSVEVTLTRPDTLSVRGYKGVRALGQTVVWTRASPGTPRCK